MYRLSGIPGYVTRIADSAMIPADRNNSDYQAYLAWVAAGNVASPAAPG